MAYDVRLTERAERDVDKIYLYIQKRASNGAHRWYRALLDTLDLLRTNPLGRPLAPESRLCDGDVRQILFKTKKGRTYRALFLVCEKDQLVSVVAVRGPAQDLMTAKEIDAAIDE